MFKRNVIANFFGRAWPNVLAFLFVPIYIEYLGIEAYGLIGFFTSLQAMFSFLDLGLSTTANREVAMRHDQPSLIDEMRKIIRTLEVVYIVTACLIVTIFLLSADWLSAHWITAEGLPIQTIKLAVIVFGATLALRWPVTLYGNVMLGMERQVLYNTLSTLTTTLKSVGAVLVVIFWSPTILAFLFWQLGIATFEFLLMAVSTWHLLPKSQSRATFDIKVIKGFWRFSALLSVNAVMAAVLKQMDRLLLSGLMPLQSVGYYSTASSAYTGMGMLQIPLSDASFPRYSRLIAENRVEELAGIYHKTCQYMSFISAPLASIVFYFSYEILWFWTQSLEVAQNAAMTLSLLALAYVLNAMMRLSWRLQLAYGVPRLMVISNFVALLVLFPAMYILIEKYGINGAGIGWLLVNVGYYVFVPHWMHKVILPTHKWRWYFYDTFPFLLLSWFVFGIAYLVHQLGQNLFLSAFALGIASIVYLISCYKLYPAIRFVLLDGYQRIFCRP